MSCDWYRATARRGEYSLSNAVVDTGAYTVECLLGVVELEYQTGSDTFTIDADQLTVLELKCRQTSKASSSGMHLRAWPRAALSSTSQKVCSHGRWTGTGGRLPRTSHQQDQQNARRQQTARGFLAKRSTSSARRLPAKRHGRRRRPARPWRRSHARGLGADWVGGEEGAASQRVCAAALCPARGSSRRLAQSIAAGGWVVPCTANARRRRMQRRPVQRAWATALGFDVVDNSRGGRTP